ncbi:MAG: FAD-dependent oxidoreductase [Bacteroidales bacterium]
MQQYDVIIIGGGPAGLQCALELSRSDLKILLLEKATDFGDKLCAGGLTAKDLQLLSLPQHLLQQSVSHASLYSRKRVAHSRSRTPFLYTVNRMELGRWQRSLLKGSHVEIRTGSQVTAIDHGKVVLRSGESIGFRYLVGADGYTSIVRRHLGLKMKKRLVGYQFTIPLASVTPKLEIFLDAGRFDAWYAWSFPHRTSIAVGCCCDPGKTDHLKVRSSFLNWLRERDIDPGSAVLESYPIGCDYQGHRFGNIFLAGDAAGLASWFTGEGIYQSLVSGQEIAGMIMDPAHEPLMLRQALKYNRILERILKLFLFAGPFKGGLQELLIFLMSRKRISDRINAGFS